MADTTEVAEKTIDDDKQADADFEAGAAMEITPDKKPEVSTEADQKIEPKPAVKEPAVAAKPAAAAPEYVQITKEKYAELEAVAKKTATHEQQLSKAFGTIGDLQKIVKTAQAQTPRGLKVEVPKDAFAALAKDFPELAEHLHAGLEATFKGLTGTGSASAEIDPAKMESLVTEHVTKLQIEALEDAYPDWKTIVGAVDTRKNETPDAANPFRKWLATKDSTYQARVNNTSSAAVIMRAIRSFKTETKPAPGAKPGPKPGLKAQLRAARIAEAVQPKGDRGHPSRNTDDEFESGFTTG